MTVLKPKLFDSHAHLTDEAYAGLIDPVVERARESGVTRIVTIGLDVETSKLCRDVAHKYGLYFAAGVHPAESANVAEHYIDELRPLFSDPRNVAIGEIGLDFYWPEPSPEPQYKVFHDMLELAGETGKPIVIHQRNSYDAVIEMLMKYPKVTQGVFHCWSGTAEQVEAVTAMGFHVSFAGNVTYKKADWENVVRAVPTDRLLIETDSPYLTPIPFRGKQNEPGYVKFTAIKIAEFLKVPLEEIMQQTFKNASTLFNIPD